MVGARHDRRFNLSTYFEWAAFCTPVLAAFIVYFGHSQVAAIAQVNAAPLIDEVKYSMIHYQLGFTLTEILRIMLFQHLIPHAVNYAVAAVF